MRRHDDVPESVFPEEGEQGGITARDRFYEGGAATLTVPSSDAGRSQGPQARDEATGPGRARRRWLGLSRMPWPLLMVLAGQVLLSLRLVWSDTADANEALNLWAGHLEWSHWLHGIGLPAFPLYFSGAPVIYPPLGALADSFGGLAVARILSLGFMLAATVLLWATARRLGGRRTAFFAAGGWAALGPTISLGAYASQEPLSLFLVALAAWCVAVAATHRHGTGWLLAATVALAAANAAAYGSAVFDPVIVAIAVLADVSKQDRKTAIAHGAAVLTYITAVLILLIKLAGLTYTTGIWATTFPGQGPQVAAGHVLPSSHWTGGLLVAAACGVLLSLVGHRQWYRTILMAVLAGAALLAPAAHAITHPVTSLADDADFGMWFAAIAAGYGVDRAATLMRFRVWRAALTGTCALALIPLAWGGAGAAGRYFSWPDASAFVTAYRPLAEASAGRMLIEDAPIIKYYLTAGRQWLRWSDTFSITAPSGRSVGYSTSGITASGDPEIYHRYLDSGYFSVIALNFTVGIRLDAKIAAWLDHDPAYRIVMRVPYGRVYYIVWQHADTQQLSTRHVNNAARAYKEPR
jgi:hypothetical protein